MNKQRFIELISIVVVSALLVAINFYSLKITSSIRAYINGESLYSKGQKDASNYLTMYMYSKDEDYWRLFKNEINIPLGDSIARIALTQEKPDLELARQGFLNGKNHEEDVENMIWLTLTFKDVPFMKQAIQIWKDADREIGRLVDLSNECKIKLNQGISAEEEMQLVNQIQETSLKLTKLEGNFSDVLGTTARKIRSILFIAQLLSTLFVIGIAARLVSIMFKNVGEANDRFKEILHFGKIGSCEIDISKGQVHLSSELNELLEEEDTEPRTLLLEAFLATYVTDETTEKARKILFRNKATSREEIVDSEFELISAKGRKIWIDCKVIIKNGDNNLCLMHDITEKKESENILKLSKLKYQKLFDNMPGMYFVLNRNFEIAMVNDFGATHLGFASDELIGQSVLKVFPNDMHEAVLQNLESCLLHPNEVSHWEAQKIKNDGQLITVQETAWIEVDPEQNVFINITCDDITDRKKAERIKEELLDNFEKLHNHIPGFIYEFQVKADGTFNFPFVSSGVEKVYGFTAAELMADPNLISQYWHPEDAQMLSEGIQNAVTNQSSSPVEFRIIKPDNSVIWVRTDSTVEQQEDGSVTWYGFTKDITASKLQEQNLAEAIVKAEKASKAKSEFLANMSHEIRTPLNGVVGFTNLLMDTNLEKSQTEYLSIINQSANSLLDIVNNVLDFSKIEAGKMELNLEEANLCEVCQQVYEITHFQATRKNLKVTLDCPVNQPYLVMVDTVRLKQVLVNLMSNAIKFTQEGEIKLNLKIKGESSDNNKLELRISVIDSGVGIKEENQKKIFEAFSQEDISVTKKYGGTGLGLSISNQILQLMGSSLQLVSEPGKGSEFFFDLKLKLSESNKIQQQTSAKETLTKAIHTHRESPLKILIAEDNLVNMTLSKSIISNSFAQIELLEAKNGEVAVEMFVKHNPDLILMDIQMPEMNGYEAAAKIRSIESSSNDNGTQTPIIALTAGAVEGEKERCTDAGMNDFISKPIVNQSLENVILKWGFNKN